MMQSRQLNPGPAVRALATCLVLGAFFVILTADAQANTAESVRGEFLNPWYTQDPTPPLSLPQSFAVFSGGVWDPEESVGPERPCAGGSPCTGSTVFLTQAAFGQPFTSSVPYAGFAEDAIEWSASQLYYTEGDDDRLCSGGSVFCHEDSDCPGGETCTGIIVAGCVDGCVSGQCTYCSADAALRYKHLLYEPDPGDPSQAVVNLLEAGTSTFSFFYDVDERTRLDQATQVLEDAIKYDPNNRQLRLALLDLYFDRAVAELALAKEHQVDATKARVISPGAGTCTTTLSVIGDEIVQLQQALGADGTPGGLRFALQSYFEMLGRGFGVDAGSIDPTAVGTPFGRYIFQQEVPLRSQYAASYLDPNNNMLPSEVAGQCSVTGSEACQDDADCVPVGDGGSCATCQSGETCSFGAPLFSGYKDLTMILGLLRDYTDVATELARKYVMRSTGTDLDDARTLIVDTHQRILLDGQLLLSMFGGLPGPGDPSGVAEAISGWESGLTRMSEVLAFINGDANILGFADDFLLLIHPDETQGPSGGSPDSYNNIAAFLDPTEPISPLGDALTAQVAAFDAYGTYRGNLDQIAASFAGNTSGYGDRLHEIVGKNQGEPGYDTPFDCVANVGSAICQQKLSIEIAINGIRGNTVEQSILDRRVQNEIDRRAKTRGINNAIASTQISYGNQQASVTETIGFINASQKAADNLAFEASNAGTGNLFGTAAFGINAMLQYGLELWKGKLEGKKEKLAATEAATITNLNASLQDLEIETLIKNLVLEKERLLVDSYEGLLVLSQENARLVALLTEKEDLERKIDSANASLTRRWFADPSHRLRVQAELVEADNTFKDAQRWMYILARALEYKWNTPFVFDDAAGTWSVGSIYRARTATELECAYDAMAEFNFNAGTNPSGDPVVDVISLKDDIFGFADGQSYADPVTGELVTAIEAFRTRLREFVDIDGKLDLELSTVLTQEGSSFFFSEAVWNDKIASMQVSLISPQALTSVPASLRYGGTSFLRNPSPGSAAACIDECLDGTCTLGGNVCSTDGECTSTRPDRVCGEMTAYSNRHWFYDLSLTPPAWNVTSGLRATIPMHLTTDPPPSTCAELDGLAGRVTDFEERSVAATAWRLEVEQPALSQLDIDQLNDIEFRICHEKITRQ